MVQYEILGAQESVKSGSVCIESTLSRRRRMGTLEINRGDLWARLLARVVVSGPDGDLPANMLVKNISSFPDVSVEIRQQGTIGFGLILEESCWYWWPSIRSSSEFPSGSARKRRGTTERCSGWTRTP